MILLTNEAKLNGHVGNDDKAVVRPSNLPGDHQSERVHERPRTVARKRHSDWRSRMNPRLKRAVTDTFIGLFSLHCKLRCKSGAASALASGELETAHTQIQSWVFL